MSPSTASSAAQDELPVIEVKNLTKEYRLGALESLRSTAKRLLGKKEDAPKRQFKALDDVSFSIRRGEVVGIIGHNGAGKSTLLKHLCRITTPTSGSVKVQGRIAPLIEVGAGLVGEMTGRENIYLNATILGLKRAEIDAKVDEIVDFSELDRFIDTPVKRYSSGMQVRLGFAIATAVDCDVLIVDEVLAVGDISFQQKCLDRIAQYIHGRQRTVLVVGHNIRQLERVCDRLIMLDHGRVLMDGSTAAVASRYFADAQRHLFEAHASKFVGLTPQEAVDFVQVTAVDVGVDAASGVSVPTMHSPLCVSIRFRCDRKLLCPEFIVGLHTLDFVHLLSVGSAVDSRRPDFEPGEYEVSTRIRDIPLRPGVYGLRVAIVNEFRQIIWLADNIQAVRIEAGAHMIARMPEASLIDVPADWNYGDAIESGNPQAPSV
jgi:ABC-type polysaccharide/polyol phosphate transport system ATPase subunit